MKKQFGVVGFKGKIGSVLLCRAGFVPVDVDITSTQLRLPKVDIIVNCAGMGSIDTCETQYKRAVELNVSGLRNLHQQFGKSVLNLGSEQIYPGSLFVPKEYTVPYPINSYGLTKIGAEAISSAFDGKTIRLSRSVSINDPDIREFIFRVQWGEPVYVPIYMTRNYLTRAQVVTGIEYFVHHYEELPHIVNYGSAKRYTYFKLIKELVKALGMDASLVRPKFIPDKTKTPRPLLSGLNTSLAKKLNFPMFDLADTVSELKDEYEKRIRSVTGVQPL